MKYESYIFDLDGTLIESLRDLKESCNYALQKCNMPVRTLEEVRMFVGNGVKKLMERAVPNGLANPRFEEAYAIFRDHYLHHNLDHTAPYPGIMDMLASLRDNHKEIAVVSNKFYTATQQLVHHFFSDYVSVAIGERENIRKKPAPTPFWKPSDNYIDLCQQLCILATVMWTLKQQRTAAYHVSVSYGDFVTRTFLSTTVLPPLPPRLLTY